MIDQKDIWRSANRLIKQHGKDAAGKAAHGGETPVRVYRERLSASGPGLRPARHPTALVA
jgi:hypothetical protein